MTSYTINIPAQNGSVSIECIPGSPVVFLGANGSGKSRLGVLIEEQNVHGKAHRIGAHRALNLNPKLESPDLETAESNLLYGSADQNHQNRNNRRWSGKPSTILLNDFDHLIRALYADQNYEAGRFMSRYLAEPKSDYNPGNKLTRLQAIWEKLLPHLKLKISTGNIEVISSETDEVYSASDLSDGERVIFYLIAQSLMVKPSGVLIIDEPELHINKAILPDLFDMIETERCDCSIIYFTHDPEFAASRYSSSKYIVKSYRKKPQSWLIEKLSEGTEFPEELVSKIQGSRRPVLFVEGKKTSLDEKIYRLVYTDRCVMSVESCEAVIQAVKNFNKHDSLHRVNSKGIIDCDFLSIEDKQKLASDGIYVLPVAEIENVFLMPAIIEMLARHLLLDPKSILKKVQEIVFRKAKQDVDEQKVASAKFYVERKFKSLPLKSKSTRELEDEINQFVSQINIPEKTKEYETGLLESIDSGCIENVLAMYKNKGLLAEIATIFGMKGKREVIELVIRLLSSKETSMIDKLREILPSLDAVMIPV